MSFAAPPEDRWLEDYEPGSVHEFGDIEVEEAEVLAFGRRFDPQPFHTDPAAARETEYGGLIASGWHTAALMMRLYSDHYLSRISTLVSPGVDELRWLRPVRPRRPALHPRHRPRRAPLALQAGPRHRPFRRRGARPARRGGDDRTREQLLLPARPPRGDGHGEFRMSTSHIDRARRICLALPETT
jgi:hypothetical protein